MLYRECSPSDWASVSEKAPAVLALVLTKVRAVLFAFRLFCAQKVCFSEKENWMMHHKFPCVSLLCCFYSLLKSKVLHVHNLLCPEQVSCFRSSVVFEC